MLETELTSTFGNVSKCLESLISNGLGKEKLIYVVNEYSLKNPEEPFSVFSTSLVNNLVYFSDQLSQLV